jgi:putative membrane-bound dehydrogenase-like protein
MKRRVLVSLFYSFVAASLAWADEFPVPRNTEPARTSAMDASEAAASFRVPPGFRVSVFAAEPDVRNPVAMAWDPRGRLWVAENYTYAEQALTFDLRYRDRVLIFEDSDSDGHFDRRTVFIDDVQRLASVEVGLGGVWLLCPPRLLFVPDRNHDDVADGAPEVVLDGFTVPRENYHTFANGLRWGPDGWLYGRCGASSPGLVGAPETAEGRRVPIRGGIWRYHPIKKRFEVLAHGTTNPWGHDWNALGEAFFINTVGGHLWHLIPGSHLVRPHTIEPNSRVYAPIDQHADHWHWDHSRPLNYGKPGAADAARGGGHAHSGMTIYQGDQWPEAYRGKLLTLNFHGRRVNVERLERDGSGYSGRHEPDILFAADPWFRGIDLGYGPDGGVTILDWSDTGECHEHDGVHRGSGRIYKVTYGGISRPIAIDLTRSSEHELVELHRHPNEWWVRQARRVLCDRAARGEPLREACKQLNTIIENELDVVFGSRALWTLHAIGGVRGSLLTDLLDHPNEALRAWAVRLLTDDMPIDTVFSERPESDVAMEPGLYMKLCGMAVGDPSGLVRLVLASTLQRLPVDQRLNLARGLVGRGEDAADHNLPTLIWTGLILVAERDPMGLAKLAGECRIPRIVAMISRRLTEEIESRPAALSALLAAANTRPAEFGASVVEGMSAALAGWRKARKPDGWDAFTNRAVALGDSAMKERIRNLDVLFGDGRALDEVRRLALDEKAELEARKAALRVLVEARPADLRAVCERLIRVRYLNSVAVRGLVLYDDPDAALALARSYRSFHPSERRVLVETLVSRGAFAQALLDQIALGQIPREALSPFDARQILSLGNAAVSKKLGELWGEVRQSSADRQARISALKQTLDSKAIASADRGRGRVLFQRMCGTCHRLYGVGGEVGPDLTGSGRQNLDYLLENIVDPGATVTADFRMSVVAMKDGRILNGMVKASTPRTITLQTQNEPLALDREEVESIAASTSSLMPEGLLETVKPDEVRDLIGYLSYPVQVPLAGGILER